MCSRTNRMSRSGATYSAIRVDRRRGPRPRLLEPPGAQVLRLLRIEALAGEHVQRATIVAAEHARDRQAVLARDALRDLAALSHPHELVLPGDETQTHPSASRQMPSGPTPPVNAANSRRSDSDPSLAIVNAVRHIPNDSPTTSVEPSGVMTIPFGKRSSSAATRWSPVSVSTCQHHGGGGLATAVQIEAEEPM